MSRVLPILFNTDMVRAILDGRKRVTRRCVKLKRKDACGFNVVHRKSDNVFIGVYEFDENENEFGSPQTPPYEVGDILYVRETWAFISCIGCNGDYARGTQPCYDFQSVEYDDGDSISDGCFVYRVDCRRPEKVSWSPSIHMPKQAARIWLEVTDVRVERLQDMNTGDFMAEGVGIRPEAYNDPENAYQQARKCFMDIWDRTVKKSEIDQYGWAANPWVWVIGFERCEKPEFC